jgi:tetratricopeptide (TPR) repeat protein
MKRSCPLEPARHALFQEQDAETALKLLHPLQYKPLSASQQRAMWDLAALAYRQQRRFDLAYQIYLREENPFLAGYCLLLAGEVNSIGQYWTPLLERRPNHWCATLWGLVTGRLMLWPTFLQIRNFLEADIASLIHAQQFLMLENLLTVGENLVQINMETPKYMGRAMMNAGWLDRAEPYFMQAQKLLPQDPEIYFHLAQLRQRQGQTEELPLLLKQCLMIIPGYVPAKKMLASLGPL